MGKMRFQAIFPEIYVSAAVLYSTVSTSESRAADILDFPWQDDADDGVVSIYRTQVPWTPVDFQKRHGSSPAFLAWVTLLAMCVCIALIVCLFCVCLKFGLTGYSRRQSSSAGLVDSTELPFQTTENEGRITDPEGARTTGNIYGRGVVNFTFVSDPQDPVPAPWIPDVPPEYSTVMSPNDRTTNAASYPVVCPAGAKTVETPPPSYTTLAPFVRELS